MSGLKPNPLVPQKRAPLISYDKSIFDHLFCSAVLDCFFSSKSIIPCLQSSTSGTRESLTPLRNDHFPEVTSAFHIIIPRASVGDCDA
ncbi:hypothetical protein L596_013538 [Steinernema carpocapsae]|uniref:Uncharacterized protein n=1 Tax=Steinernema carpocapsae TaxID=34508 RepID=A0A4U5P1B9_STECR|nr:hypothetical protein L596_013538 [Steinernema carpocapsae]